MATLKFVAIEIIQVVVYPMVVILIVRIVIVRFPWFVSIDNSIRDDWGNRNASIFPSRNTISKPATRLKRFIYDADHFSDFWGITY